MSSTHPGVRASDALRMLRERYRATSAGLLDCFRDLAAQLSLNPTSPSLIFELRSELHRVHGTAGSYGFAEASTLAGKLEIRVARWEADASDELSQRATIIGHFVSALTLALAADVTVAPATSRRRMLVLDLSASSVRLLRSEAAVRGYHLATGYAADLDPQMLRSQAPHLILATPGAVAGLRDVANAMNIPLVVIREGLVKESSELPSIPDGVAELTLGGDATALFDLADRLSLGSSWVGATVLVLDDDPSILAIVRYLLESEGVRIETTDEPGMLHRRLSATAPSLLLMDVRLGAVSGIDLARELRVFPAFTDLPIILISTDATPEIREAAREAGVDGFIAKPIVAAELRSSIAEHLERHRVRRLGDGRHPGTGLPLTARMQVDATTFIERMVADGSGIVAAIIRPDASDLSGDTAAMWLRETHRIANAVAGAAGVAGYHDGVSMLVLLEGDAEIGESLFEALSRGRGEGIPTWWCGVCDAATVGSFALDTLSRAAEDALELARHDRVAAVRRWRPEEVNLAPDVILVEDDVALSEMMQFVLRSANLSFRSFSNGAAALDALLAFRTEGRCPLVLLDVDLPGIDGHALHERLSTARPDAFAVVFITGHVQEGDQIRALRAGALDYVPKPVTFRSLLAKIPVWRERASRARASSEAVPESAAIEG